MPTRFIFIMVLGTITALLVISGSGDTWERHHYKWKRQTVGGAFSLEVPGELMERDVSGPLPIGVTQISMYEYTGSDLQIRTHVQEFGKNWTVDLKRASENIVLNLKTRVQEDDFQVAMKPIPVDGKPGVLIQARGTFAFEPMTFLALVTSTEKNKLCVISINFLSAYDQGNNAGRRVVESFKFIGQAI